MKITFTEYPENLPELVYHLDLEKEDRSILVSIIKENMISGDLLDKSYYRLNKEQLRDFIGSLLHLQSKMK